MNAMNDDRHSRQVHEPDRRTGRRHDTQSDAPSTPAELYVKSLGRGLTEAQALRRADVLMLLSEDCCWQAATEHWRRRRPPVWHHEERRGWRAEGRLLRKKSQRLLELGSQLGLMPTEHEGRRWRFGRDHH